MSDWKLTTTAQCEACGATFEARNSRPRNGVFLCGRCEMNNARRVIRRYQSFQKAHLTDGERARLSETGTIAR